MNIKMIVTDLDGTLLRNNKTISQFTASVLERCRFNDIKIVLASARPERNIKEFSNIIFPYAIISNNGAKISCNNTILQQNFILPKSVQGIIGELLALPETQITLDYDNASTTNCNDYLNWGDSGVFYSCFVDYNPNNVQKIVVGKTNTDILKIINFNNYGCHAYYCPDTKWHMIMAKEAVKVNAVKFLAEQYGISLAETVAFGDDHNDVEMLRECGIGVAVANANNEAKTAANTICDTNNNDGVAKWIKANISN